MFNRNNEPTPALKELLALLNIEHDNSFNSILDATQKAWLRKSGQERWEMPDILLDEEQKKKIFSLFSELGLIKKQRASYMRYDYALILGSDLEGAVDVMGHLIEEFHRGVTVDNIVFLTGARPLDPNIENLDVLKKIQSPCLRNVNFDPLPLTEAEMMEYVWNCMNLPESLSNQRITIINAPMQSMPDGSVRRPNTADTFKMWLDTSPVAGTCLVISSQPYIGYQEAVARIFLPNSFTLDAVGGESHETNIAVYLDTITRWLYQERGLLNPP